jgi:bacillithiol biosynthesis deacetylase BshB1
MSDKLDFLAFGAHPDDVELGCGATIAKLVSQGKKVGIVDLTRGELGTRGSAEIRTKETKEASKILGITIRENMDFKDGFFRNDEEHQLKIIQVIRKYQPDFVFCNAPDDRHIDHPKGSQLIVEASFLSGLTKINTDDSLGNAQMQWRPKNIYHYIQWKNLDPDFIFDVSGFHNTKMDAVKCYSSQFYDPKSKEPETPISTKNFMKFVQSRANDFGRLIGVEHGEGFISNRKLGFSSFDELI